MAINTPARARLWGERLLQGLIILLPVYLIRFEIGVIKFNLLDIFVTSGFIICLVLYRPIQLGVWKYIMGSFAIIGLIAVLVSSQPMAALGLYKSYIIVPLLFGYIVLTVRPGLETILQAAASTIGYMAIVGIWQFCTGYGIPAPWNTPGENFRITSVYDYPNAVGLLLAPLLTLLLAYLVQRGQAKPWIITTILLGGVLLLWSHSDGAIVAVLAAVAFSLLFTRWWWWTLLVGSIGLIGLFSFAPTRQILLLQDTSGEVRLALWQGTANLLAHHPITGAGLAGFPDLYAQYKLDRHVELLLYPHNLILDFWVELGILGVVWLVVVVGRFFWIQRQTPQPSAVIIMSGLVAMLVYGLVDVPYFKNDLALVFWLLLTLADTQLQQSASAVLTKTKK